MARMQGGTLTPANTGVAAPTGLDTSEDGNKRNATYQA